MSFSDLVTRMMNAGAPLEAVRIAIEAVEAERAKIDEARAKRREQKQRERDRKADVARQSHDKGATVAAVSHDTPPDGPPLPPAPLTPPLNPPISLSASAQTLQANAEFGQWWNEYPHKVGKAAALPAFLKARKRASLADLVDGVRVYRDRLRQPNAPNPCNPATWLNEDRWLDQPMSPPDARQSPPSKTAEPRGASAFAAALAELRQDFGGQPEPAGARQPFDLDLSPDRPGDAAA